MKSLVLIVLTILSLLGGCKEVPVKGPLDITSKLHIYQSDISGFNTKNFFYDNGQEVIVFDTQFTPEFARKSIDFIRSKTPHPITYVVITHPSPDKFNGLIEFERLGAKVVASSRTTANIKNVHEYKKHFFLNIEKTFTEEIYPEVPSIDITFDQTYDLRLNNGEIIKLYELSEPGVSTNQTVAWIQSIKAVMVGDLVHHHAHAWLEGGIVNGNPSPTLNGWLNDLNELKAMFKDESQTLVYGGRGEVVELSRAVDQQKIYLREADRIVTRYIVSLGTRKSELKGEKAVEHYKILQREFEKVFPHYQFGYMIQYGIYGLVNSKL